MDLSYHNPGVVLTFRQWLSRSDGLGTPNAEFFNSIRERDDFFSAITDRRKGNHQIRVWMAQKLSKSVNRVIRDELTESAIKCWYGYCTYLSSKARRSGKQVEDIFPIQF